MKYDIREKAVIISGASGGIGRELVRMLVNDFSCRIIGIGRNEEKMQKLCESLADKKELFSYRLFDVSDKSSWQNFAQELKDAGTIPDILINNAGILPKFRSGERMADAGALSDEMIRITQTNYFSAVYAIDALLPLMKRSASPHVVNVASSAALASLPGTSLYSASKSALRAFSDAVSLEHGICVSTICPGFTKTDIFREQKAERSKVVDFFSASAEKTARKMLRAIIRRRRFSVIGADAHLMSAIHRIFGYSGLRFLAWIIDISGIGLFRETFYENTDKK